MNIKQRMKELVDHFNNNRFNGINVYLRPELENEWHRDYAISEGLYYDDEGEYFDNDTFRQDLMNFVDDWFDVKKHYYESSRDKERPVIGELVVRYYWQAQELEVYHQGSKLLRKFKTNIQGKKTCHPSIEYLASQLDGQTMTLEDAIDILETSHIAGDCPKLDFEVKNGTIIGEERICDDEGCPIHSWILVEFEDIERK